jgi:hypothetical protein
VQNGCLPPNQPWQQQFTHDLRITNVVRKEVWHEITAEVYITLNEENGFRVVPIY